MKRFSNAENLKAKFESGSIVIKIPSHKTTGNKNSNNSIVPTDSLNSFSELKLLDNNLTFFLIDYKNQNEMTLTEEKINTYLSLLDTHKSFVIPFQDHSFYTGLLEMSKQIVQNEELESWYILDQYVELNIETLSKEFLVEATQAFGKIKFFRFKFWYFLENRIVKEVKNMSNTELAKVAYSFAYAGKGSDYLYKVIAEELMRRKISNLNEEEFILVYNAFYNVKIKDKVFNLLLDKARQEKYSNL